MLSERVGSIVRFFRSISPELFRFDDCAVPILLKAEFMLPLGQSATGR
jgi:hypothetical protein